LHLQFAGRDRWPKPLHLLQGALLVQSGQAGISAAAKAVGTTPAHLMDAATAPDPVDAVLRVRDEDVTEEAITKLRRKVGELVRGRAAEMIFEGICKEHLDPKEFTLTDVHESRNNTDFRLFNGGCRKVWRFNVKFFGTLFQRAPAMVGLDSADCFPLATYKIKAALEQEVDENVPYVFAVVGVPGLNGPAVAEIIPPEEVRPLARIWSAPKMPSKRDCEDAVVDRIVRVRSPSFSAIYDQISTAEWYILSAGRADKLLHDLLFERVHALSLPGFVRNFPTAEVDMHFSLVQDMVKLSDS
jgi:hypothetical protein